MEQHLVKNTKYTYIYRAYKEYGTLRYVFSMPMSYRGHGEWEIHAWNAVNKLWPDAPQGIHAEAMLWIYKELKRVEPTFIVMIAMFEVNRMKAYRRMFRKYFDLHVLRNIEKEINGALFQGAIVEVRPKECGYGDNKS